MSLIIPLTVKIICEEESQDAPFVAYTPELDVASCGPTEEKARSNLFEAVAIVLEEAEKHGTLNAVLYEAGFRRVNKHWRPPRVSFEPFVFELSKERVSLYSRSLA